MQFMTVITFSLVFGCSASIQRWLHALYSRSGIEFPSTTRRLLTHKETHTDSAGESTIGCGDAFHGLASMQVDKLPAVMVL